MIYMKHHSSPGELLAHKYEYYPNYVLKEVISYDPAGNIGEHVEYNTDGQIIKRIVDHNNRASLRMPVIDTTTYIYLDNLLIEELEYSERNYGIPQKELAFRRSFKYNKQNKIVEQLEIDLSDNSTKKTTYEYLGNNLKVCEFSKDGKLLYVSFLNYSPNGDLLENRSITGHCYENKRNIFYSVILHMFNKQGLRTEIKYLNNDKEVLSLIKYFYNFKNMLTNVEVYEKEKISFTCRMEYQH